VKKLKEYYGTQRPSFAGGPGAGSNFYSGRDLGTHTKGSLGTRGADSNFSRRMQALVPNDYYELLEDEVIDFDEDVVVENSRYSLQKTLEINEGIFSNFAGSLWDAAVDVSGDAARAALSGATAGQSSYVFILKNIYEIKRGREKSDISIESFLSNPDNDNVLKMTSILDDLVKNLFDLIQTIVEMIPDPTPTGEIVTISGSILTHIGRLLKLLKSLGGGVSFREKLTSNLIRKTSMYAIIKPLIKFIIELFDSEYIPEKVMQNKTVIMGTLQRIVLMGDLIEDYVVQKEVAREAGIKDDDFVYQYRIIRSPSEIDNYDVSPSREETSIEERIEEETSEIEYSDSNESPLEDDDSPSIVEPQTPGSLSKAGTFLRKLFISKPGDEGLFSESLNKRSLAYLIEESDSVLDEDLDEESKEIEEFSGAGAVAGFSLPLGRSAKGPKGQHSSTSGGQSFPYTEKTRKQFNKYTKKTFGGAR